MRLAISAALSKAKNLITENPCAKVHLYPRSAGGELDKSMVSWADHVGREYSGFQKARFVEKRPGPMHRVRIINTIVQAHL